MPDRPTSRTPLEYAASLRSDPRKVLELPRHVAAYVRARRAFRGCKIALHVRAFGPVLVEPDGLITVDEGVRFLSGLLPIRIACARGAELSIGRGTTLNHGACIEAQESIRIGERCMISSMAHIGDARGAPVVLGNDVWIAHGGMVEPGVTIGDGSAVSAGSVVTKNVPPGYVAMGNPARNVPLDLLRR